MDVPFIVQKRIRSFIDCILQRLQNFPDVPSGGYMRQDGDECICVFFVITQRDEAPTVFLG